MKKGIEVSVDEAAQTLGVTSRSIINYIKAKEIEAIKVGKSWFVSKPSLESFQQRYKLGLNPFPVQLQQTEESKSADKIEKADSETKGLPEKSERQRRRGNPVHTLRLFQMSKEILQDINSNNFFPHDRVDLHQKFLNLKTDTLELVGAGFYSYDNKMKARLYNRSRAKVGGMLSLVYFYHKDEKKLPEVIQKIEHDLMPAFSSLIKKLETKGENVIKKYSGKQGNKP